MSRILTAILTLLCASTWAAMPFLSIESPAAYYADRDCVVELRAPEGVKSISWNLRSFNRTVAAGQVAADAGGKFRIKFHFPKLNDGVIASATLTCLGPENDALLTKELNFFPPNPFSNSTKFMTEQKIELFEADGSGRMAKLLNSLKVPFSELSGFGECSGKILIISGMDFDQYTELQNDFLKLMQHGVQKIIVVNPVSGRMPIAVSGFDQSTFTNNDIIRKLNPKLDAALPGKSLSLSVQDDSIGISVDNKNNSSKYCLFRHGKSELYILSWDIAGLAADSPAPVYILSKLILNQ